MDIHVRTVTQRGWPAPPPPLPEETAETSVPPTCDRPKWTDAVSEMYIILPSGATTKMKPSKV